MATVFTKIYDAPPIDRKELFRYAGARESLPELEALVDECISEICGKLSFKVCYTELDIAFFEDYIDLGFMKCPSKDLRKNLLGCDKIVLFAATVGIEIDRLVARYSALSPTKALIFNALGTERIESLCDLFCGEIAERYASLGKKTRPRFSAGYGDLKIEAQRDIFDVLSCPSKIGISLGNNLLMSPRKSVTAIIGVLENKNEHS